MSKEWIDENLERQIIGTFIGNIGDFDPTSIKAEYFTKGAYKTLYETAYKLWVEGKPTDLVGVSSALDEQGTLSIVGGYEQLAKLVTDIPTAASEKHCLRLQDLWRRRKADYIIRNAQEALRDGKTTVADIISEIDTASFDVIADDGRYNSLDKVSQMSTVLEGLLNPTEDAIIKTAWPSLNSMIGGLRGGELIILGGRPGMGKTAVMCSAQIDLARAGVASLSFSMDMGRNQLWHRYVSQISRIGVQDLETFREFNGEEQLLIRGATEEIINLPLMVDSSPYRSMADIRRIARQQVMKKNVRVVFVDHIGLVRAGKAGTRQEEVADISKALKAMSKELDITVVCLVQLNRGLEYTEDKRPSMKDLRESGSIEQDADIVLMAYRPEYYKMDYYPNTTTPAKGSIEIIGSKVRNGPPRSAFLAFEGQFTRVYEPKEPLRLEPTNGSPHANESRLRNRRTIGA